MDAIKTGNYIREKREARGLTQEQLADQIGFSTRSVQKWESGSVSNIKLESLEKLADVLKVSLNEIRAGQDLDINDDIKTILDEQTRQIIQAEEKALFGIEAGIYGIAVGYLALGFAGSAKYPKSISVTIFLLLLVTLSLALIFYGRRYIKRNEQDLKKRKASTSAGGNDNANRIQQ